MCSIDPHVVFGLFIGLSSSWQTGGSKLYKQRHTNRGRRGALHEHLRQLAGCYPPFHLSVVYQHSTGQPSYCYVQVCWHLKWFVSVPVLYDWYDRFKTGEIVLCVVKWENPVSEKIFALYICIVRIQFTVYSYTFSKVQEHSDIYWKFQRYNLSVEHHSRPCLAPPFIIILHLHLFIKRHIRRLSSVKSKHFGEK